MGKVKRVYALTNTASGVAGEAAVTAALLRAGLRVAKPFWTDNEVDLLVFWEEGSRLIPIPVQVKSVQAQPNEDEAMTQGLRKRYIEASPYLCLAIYSVARNKIWFIQKSENIKNVYRKWADAPKTGPGAPRTKYDDIDLQKGDVNIRVNVSKAGNAAFDAKWLIDTEDASKVTKVFAELAKEINASDAARNALTHFIYESAGGVMTLGGSADASVIANNATAEDEDGIELASPDEAEKKLKDIKKLK